MTDDLTRAENALRSLLVDRSEDAPSVPGLYPAVRRRYRRRRWALAGTAAVLVLAAIAVPVVTLQERSAPTPITGATPPPAPRSCPSIPAAPRPKGGFARLPAQHDVRGSLGGDPAAVTAVLHAAWAHLQPSAIGPDLDPATVRVRSVQQIGGAIVGTVTVTDAGRHAMSQATAVGPDLAHLHGEGGEGGSSGAGIPDPITTTFFDGDANIELVSIGCTSLLSLVAPPGSAASVSWISGIAADGTAQRSGPAVTLRPDGVGLVAVPAGTIAVRARLLRGGHVLAQQDVRLPNSFPTSDDALRKEVLAAPGDGNRNLAAGILNSPLVQAAWPPSSRRVLWNGLTSTGDAVPAAVLTLPSGAQVVWGGATKLAGVTPGGRSAFAGLLPAGALDRSALLWRLPTAGHPVAVFVSGTRQVRIERGGTSETRTVTGGTMIESGDAVTGVFVGSVPAIDVTTLARPDGLFVVKGL